jgi:hypothetical protein
MPLIIQYQGYSITAPDGPSEQGSFTSHPTRVQVVSQIDNQFVFTEPVTMDVLLGEQPANELIWGTLTLQCYWDTLYNRMAQESQITDSVSFTSGITTTDSETTTFGLTLGVSAGALPEITAALTASFSKAETHSVALSESKTESLSVVVMPQTTLQVWQLHSDYISEFEKDGKTYRYVLSDSGSIKDGLILALTFPEKPQSDQ